MRSKVMEDQKHFIQKQKLIFDFRSEEKASAWNKNASTFYYADVLPLLNQLFNKYIPPDQLYSIDTLEIDLGKVKFRDISERLIKQLEAKFNAIPTDKDLDLTNSEENLSKIERRDSEASLQNTVIVREAGDKLLELLYTFLDHGILAWNSNFEDIEKLEDAVVKQIGIDTLMDLPDFRRRIKQPFIRKRLFYQFSSPIVEQIFRKLLPKEFDAIELFKNHMRERIQAAAIKESSKRISRKIISEEILKWIVSSESAEGDGMVKEIIHTTISRIEQSTKRNEVDGDSSLYHLLLFGHEDEALSSFYQVFKFIESHPSYQRIMKRVASEERAPDSDDREKESRRTEEDKKSAVVERPSIQDSVNVGSVQTLDKSDEGSQIESHEKHSESKESGQVIAQSSSDLERIGSEVGKKHPSAKSESKVYPQTEVAEQTKKKYHDRTEALTEYYVMNAGIVLCWPYLHLLFDRLGYLLASDFRDQDARERAVHILGYIAAGHDKFEEHELTFQKFLAGWPFQMPLVKDLKLFKKEKRECDAMLRSLISNWPILKNTSIEGLRSSFFQRNGKLRKEDESWRIIVEQKSYDMLLDHLSYSIAIIKLPWFKEILKVDWA
jgi:hypothetical protein